MDLNELEVGSFASELQLKIDKQLKKEKNPEISENVIFEKGNQLDPKKLKEFLCVVARCFIVKVIINSFSFYY